MFGWYGNTRTPHGQLYNVLTIHVRLSPPVDAVVSFASRSTTRWVTVQYEGIANLLDLLDLVGPAYRSPWSFVHETIIGGNSKIKKIYKNHHQPWQNQKKNAARSLPRPSGGSPGWMWPALGKGDPGPHTSPHRGWRCSNFRGSA